jgi:MFS transporter, DHA2 family, multidrug resistance protein
VVGAVTAVEPARAGRREWVSLAVLALPTLLVSMDLTVMYLAVPHISADLEPTGSQLLWIADIYGFLIAGSLITMGTLGDRIGRRRLLLIGAAAFGIVSALAAFSTSAEMLIATRALLGVAGATLMPSTLALIRNLFADARQRTVAIGVWVSTFSAGAAIGPVIGGVLLEHFWWGSVLLLGVPVMAVLLVLGPMLLPEFRDPDAGRLDLTSAALSVTGVLAVIYGLKQIAENGTGWTPALSIALGLGAGVVFVHRQQRLTHPLLDLRLFRVTAFSAALGTETLALFAYAGTYLFLAQYLQLVYGLSPLQAGLWLLPATGATILGSTLTPFVVRRIRPAFILGTSLIVAAVGFAMLTQVDVGSGLALVVIASVVFDVGIVPSVTLGTDIVVGAAPPERAGAASAISETATELGLALGVAIIGSIGTAAYRGAVTDALPSDAPRAAAEAARDSLGGAQAVAEQLAGPIGPELFDAARDAFIQGLHAAATTSAVVAAAVAILAAVLLRRVRPSSEPGEQPALEPDETTAAPPIPPRGPCAPRTRRFLRRPLRRVPTPQMRGGDMGLSSHKVRASIAVSDMSRAVEFYENKLGLSGSRDLHDGSRVYECGGGTSLHIYASPANAGKATATLATWNAADLERVVDELRSNGVVFERYDDPTLASDQKGIHALPDGKVAWFKDPDGNTFAIEQ